MNGPTVPKIIETDAWPFIQARFFTPEPTHRDVRGVCVHTMEHPEVENTARNVAQFFKDGTRRASAHACIDSDTIIQSVHDNDVAWAAPGVNHDFIHLEHAGYAAQSAADWDDHYSTLMLDLSANVGAQYALKYSIPVVHLTDQELLDGKHGFIGHIQATNVYKPNAGHQDPGGNFPWDFYLSRVAVYLQSRKAKFGVA